MDTLETFSEGCTAVGSIDTKTHFGVSVVDAPVEIVDPTNSVSMNETPADPKLCVLCKEKNHKYKCKYCDVRYCSVKCSNAHKADTNDHEEEKEKPNSAPPPNESSSPMPKEKSTARPGTLAAANAKGPFESLNNSKELKELFIRYPNLYSHLDAVDTATLRPTGPNSHKWNQDQGWEKGRNALKSARGYYGKDGEGVREYCELVLRLLGDEDEESEEAAAETLRKEALAESTRVIRALLESEKRR
ncbi:e4a2573f-0046-446f-a765-497863ffe964 [Sclerotinia trifoliorum]|uniref:E4a2573f-0046-446f-a765-497863ffe964 n=1 Tax=Sclerotinia trifoliorum TaxID=28548 RepID=A0A8H2ZKS8_9HELO|nr:e4a2573f-0046-446f-a765-497863ffe964 [Sclerotinia trifoliorum]